MAQLSNKIQIPRKTKMAAKIMTIYGYFGLILLVVFFWIEGILTTAGEVPLLAKPELIWASIAVISYFVFPLLMLRGVYLSWNLSVIILLLEVLASFEGLLIGRKILFLLPLLTNIIPLHLLILDRKNYFAAVEKAKNKSN